MKIEEGKSYSFMVIKSLRFEEKDFFLFEGPDRKRYLLPSDRYASYNIEPGKNITCRVDKINCKGEVFLEPEHPVYSEKESYYFEVTGSDSRVDRTGNRHQVILVKDIYGNILSVPAISPDERQPLKGEKIRLLVERIAKGNIIFGGIDMIRHSEKEEDQTLVEFLLEDEVKGLDERIYFLISDASGSHYTLPADYYRHYGLSKGKYFNGRFVRYKSGEEVRIEPLNPFFTPGEVYNFIIVEVIELDSKTQAITVVKDEYGFNHNLDGNPGLAPGSNIKLRVERIRKGWPLLKVM